MTDQRARQPPTLLCRHACQSPQSVRANSCMTPHLPSTGAGVPSGSKPTWLISSSTRARSGWRKAAQTVKDGGAGRAHGWSIASMIGRARSAFDGACLRPVFSHSRRGRCDQSAAGDLPDTCHRHLARSSFPW
jgi:hypothetical protein